MLCLFLLTPSPSLLLLALQINCSIDNYSCSNEGTALAIEDEDRRRRRNKLVSTIKKKTMTQLGSRVCYGHINSCLFILYLESKGNTILTNVV